MSKIFGYDSPIVKALTRIGDIICLSALWLVFSIPIFTMGAATAAAYTAANRHLRGGKGYLWKTFWNSFRGEFKRATLVGLIGLAVMALLTADVFLFRSLKMTGSPMGNLYWVSLVIWSVALTWTFYLSTYVARINGGVRDTVKNGYLLMILHPIRSFGILLTILAGVAVVLMVPFMVLISPAVVMFICSFPQEKTFLAHQPGENREEEEDEDEYGDEEGSGLPVALEGVTDDE